MSADHPDRPPLDPQVLESAGPRWRVEVAESLPSTNAALAERAREGADEDVVLVAEHQTAGRGRLDRSWETPPGAALTFSVLLRPRVPDRRWPWVPLLAGLAVVDGVVASGGPPCDLKWPNDVQYDGLKLAGVLVERVDTPSGPAAVLGVGLNVTTRRNELPVETATSLVLAGMLKPDRSRLLVETLRALAARHDAWSEAAGQQGVLAEEYAARCDTLGRQVQVRLPDGTTVDGRAVGVGPHGELVLEGNGERRSLSAGDVVHLRVP